MPRRKIIADRGDHSGSPRRPPTPAKWNILFGISFFVIARPPQADVAISPHGSQITSALISSLSTHLADCPRILLFNHPPCPLPSQEGRLCNWGDTLQTPLSEGLAPLKPLFSDNLIWKINGGHSFGRLRTGPQTHGIRFRRTGALFQQSGRKKTGGVNYPARVVVASYVVIVYRY